MDVPKITTKNVSNGNMAIILSGRSFVLSCSANSYPKASYSWFYKGQLLSKNSILDVKSVTVHKNAGEYTCVASNSFVNKSTTFFVDIHCKKTIIFFRFYLS